MPDISSSLSKREVNARQNTYTKSEIDLKDGAIQAIAEAAQTTADAAEKKNQEQDQLIAELQEKTDELRHPEYTEYSSGLYKIAVDHLGHVADAVAVTKEDITALGIPGENTTYTFSNKGTTLKIVDNCQGHEYSVDFPSSRTITSIVPYFPNTYDEGRGFCWCQFGIGFTNISPIGYKDVGIDGHLTKIHSHPDGIAKLAIALSGASHHRVSITADLPLHNISGVEKRPLENLKIFSNTPENEIFVYAWASYAGSEYNGKYNTNQFSFCIFIYTKEKDLATAPTPQITVESTVYGENCVCTVCGSDASKFSEECRLKASKIESITQKISQKANKSDIPEKVSELENDAGYGTYTKPATGIPKSDLASGVQASLGKADTALQKHQDISGKLDKTGDASTTTVAFSAASARENVKTGEKLSVIVGKIAKWFSDLKTVAFTGSYNDLANKPTIPDGSKYLPLAGGKMTGDIDLASNGVDLLVGSQRAKQITYATAVAGATISTKQTFSSGLPERKSLVGSFLDQNSVWHSIISVRHRNGYNDGVNYGIYLRSLLTSDGSLIWNKQTGAGKWQGERVLLDSTNYSSYAAKSDHTHAMITNSALWVSGANNTAKWVKLGTLVSSGNFSNAMIRVWSGDGANGRANQNSSFEVQIKDGWQSTESATKACGVTVYRVDCSSVKVKVIPTAHDTYTVWAYMPWGYWNGNYAIYGKYKSWTYQHLIQSEEPEGTGADTAYYDHAFLTSTVAKATEATTLTDSGWQKPTFPSGVKSSSIRYRKQGKIVSVTGYVQFSTAQTTITVFTLPTGYRPPVKIQQFNAVDSSAQASFLTKIDTDGKVGFFGKTQGFFTTATEYYMHCTFFVD